MSKRIIILSLLCIITFSQCYMNPHSILSQGNLTSQFFDVPVDKDTVLHTAKGAIISIPNGALSAGTATRVKLEVKEAYSMTDIILAGLTTKAGKNILSSGGMIYINPVDNSNVTITKPISVSIPTDHQQDGMQLYKGQKKSDGTIDWTDPQPLPKQKLSEHLQNGKMLWENNCTSCHAPLKDATGPFVALTDKRRDWKWMMRLVHNPSELLASGDRISNCQKAIFGGVMTAFPDLNDGDIHAIFDYVDYTVADRDPATIPDFKKMLDSCALYNKLKRSLETNRSQLVEDNGRFVDVIVASGMIVSGTGETLAVVGPSHPLDAGNLSLVRPADNDAVYYQVQIVTFGWYNIDILTKDFPDFVKSELSVRVTGTQRDNVNLYLLMPGRKIFVEGGPLSGQTDVYGFYEDNGNIPLPQHEHAYILAMAEHDGKLYFGKTEFMTSLKQSPEIQLLVTTKEQMNLDVTKLGIDDFSFNAHDSKNADSIRKVELKLSEIEKLKPRDCNCNCGVQPDSTRSETDTASLMIH